MDNQNSNKGKWFIEQLNLYQAANGDNESIKKNFIIRKNEFESNRQRQRKKFNAQMLVLGYRQFSLAASSY